MSNQLIPRVTQLLNVVLNEQTNQLRIEFRTPSNQVDFTTDPPTPVPDTVFVNIYNVDGNGKLQLLKTVTGVHTPAYTIPETIVFPE